MLSLGERGWKQPGSELPEAVAVQRRWAEEKHQLCMVACVCEGLEVPNDLLGDENILWNYKCEEKLSRSSVSWKWVVRGAGWGCFFVHK